MHVIRKDANFRGSWVKGVASQVVLVVKKPLANAGDTADLGSFPGSGRSSGGGNGYLLQYSCLENPMNSRTWWATVHGVVKELDTTERLNNKKIQTLSVQRAPREI